MLGLNVGGKPPVTPTSASDTHPSLPLLQSNDTSVEAYEGDPEDDEEYEEEEQVSVCWVIMCRSNNLCKAQACWNLAT